MTARTPQLRLSLESEIIVDQFAGGGGASLGMEMALGRSPDIAINHDPEAVALHTANHPTTKHYCESVWDIDPAKVTQGRRIGLMWLSPDCFPAGTLVLTSRGYRSIESIKVGDLVLTHKNRWRAVTETSSTRRKIMTIRGHGHPAMRVSPEHPFYARKHQRDSADWMPASSLQKGDYWATPTDFPDSTPPQIEGRGLETDERLMWLAGRYVGDGWTRLTKERAELVITCGRHERDVLRVMLSKWPREGSRAGAGELQWFERDTSTAVQFATSHRGLVEWLRAHFGHRAEAKGIPAWALGMSVALRRALLTGYLSADGHRTDQFQECTTVSKALAFGIKALANSLCKTVAVYTGKNSDVIQGRKVTSRPVWRLRWRHEVDAAHRQTFRIRGLEWTPIREVGEPGEVERVFNIGVEGDESYVVEGIVVHNCKHFSKAKGGKPVEKKIRGLAWIAVKWAKLPNAPRVIVLENVEEFQSWGPLTEENKPCPDRKGLTFRRWVKQLENCGYVVEWRELRACDYGTPTIRKRLFLVARRDGKPIVWPTRTHAEKPTPGLKLWRTAAECIDWSIPCPSIFERERPLAENTLRRIAAGIKRYVIDAAKPFIVPLTHQGDPGRSESIDEPMRTVTGAQRGERALIAPTITAFYGLKGKSHARGGRLDQPLKTQTADPRFGLVTPYLTEHANASGQRNFAADEPLRTQCAQVKGGHFALVAPIIVGAGGPSYSGKPVSAEQPFGSLTTENHRAVIAPTLIETGYGEREGQAPRAGTTEKPIGTLVGTQKHALVTAFLNKHYTGVVGSPMTDPVHTVTSSDHNSLTAAHLTKFYGTSKTGQSNAAPMPSVTATGQHIGQVQAFLAAYYGNEKDGRNLADPMGTVTAKERFGLVTVAGQPYVIADIGMRMLAPRELYRAQGFPEDYRIDIEYKGKPLTKTAQVRMCGNSVCPPIAAAIVAANFKFEQMQEAA